MGILVKEIEAKDYLSKSGLSDFVINPYVGCPHACLYCYAQFMSKYTNHAEPWGQYLDVKRCPKPIDLSKIKGRSVLLSSVTDAYNPFEAKYRVTQGIMEQLTKADCQVTLLTKNSLSLRDIDIFKKLKNFTFAMSINTIDESFKNDMDKASSIAERFSTLETMHHNGIRTVVFIAPIFYQITSVPSIIEKSKTYVDEYWLDGLNMRGSYRWAILKYIQEKHPDLYPDYTAFYRFDDKSKLKAFFKEIDDFCKDSKVNYKAFFQEEAPKQEPTQETLF